MRDGVGHERRLGVAAGVEIGGATGASRADDVLEASRGEIGWADGVVGEERGDATAELVELPPLVRELDEARGGTFGVARVEVEVRRGGGGGGRGGGRGGGGGRGRVRRRARRAFARAVVARAHAARGGGAGRRRGGRGDANATRVGDARGRPEGPTEQARTEDASTAQDDRRSSVHAPAERRVHRRRPPRRARV